MDMDNIIILSIFYIYNACPKCLGKRQTIIPNKPLDKVE